MTEPEPSSPPLVESADTPQERSALVNRLFQEHNRSLISFLVTRLRSVHDARDVAQEAYVRLLQLDRPGAVSLLRSYLFRTAANLAVDRLRRRSVRERASIELFDEISGRETLEQTVLARQELERVRAALEQLPPKTRRAFVLHVIDGVPTPEVARLMGLKERMVRLHVSRALTRCKESLNGDRP